MKLAYVSVWVLDCAADASAFENRRSQALAERPESSIVSPEHLSATVAH